METTESTEAPSIETPDTAALKQKRKAGRPAKQETTTGVPDRFEMSSQVIGFKLENHRMESLQRLAIVYRDKEGQAYSPAQVARRLVCHAIRELEQQIDSGKLDLSDAASRLP